MPLGQRIPVATTTKRTPPSQEKDPAAPRKEPCDVQIGAVLDVRSPKMGFCVDAGWSCPNLVGANMAVASWELIYSPFGVYK